MKKKEFKKKLSLNKQTVERLNNNKMEQINGGYEVDSGNVCNTESVRMRCCNPSAEFSCGCDQIFSVYICT